MHSFEKLKRFTMTNITIFSTKAITAPYRYKGHQSLKIIQMFDMCSQHPSLGNPNRPSYVLDTHHLSPMRTPTALCMSLTPIT